MTRFTLADACRATGFHNSVIRSVLKKNPGLGFFDGNWFVTDLDGVKKALENDLPLKTHFENPGADPDREALLRFLDTDVNLMIRRSWLSVSPEKELLSILQELSAEIGDAISSAKNSIRPLCGKKNEGANTVG